MKRKDANYVQCHLQKKNTHHMAWIPEQFAVVGKFIQIKIHEPDDLLNFHWDDGWEVKGKSDGVKSAEDANNLSQLYKKTRKASDI